MKKQLWITTKQILLFLLLSQGIMTLGMLFAMSMAPHELDVEARFEYADNSFIAKLFYVLGNIVTIAIFLGKRYVKLSTGRLEHSKLWKMVCMAALVSWGWQFTEGGILELIEIDKLFPDEMEELEQRYSIMEGIYGLIAGGIVAPIVEEIGFRGVLMGGLLRMRCKPWIAIAISALIFAFYHGTYTQLIGTAVFGIITGWLYWRTRSLIPGMIIHVVNNSTISILEMLSSEEPEDTSKIVYVLFIIIFLPLLLVGLKWFASPKALRK